MSGGMLHVGYHGGSRDETAADECWGICTAMRRDGGKGTSAQAVNKELL